MGNLTAMHFGDWLNVWARQAGIHKLTKCNVKIWNK